MKVIGVIAAVAAIVGLTAMAIVPSVQATAQVMAEAQTQASARDGTEVNIRIDIDSVRQDLSVLASISHELRTEQGRCISKWKLDKVADTVIVRLEALAPMEIAWSDSLSIAIYSVRKPDGSFGRWECGGNPPLHTHLTINGDGPFMPSDLDMRSLDEIGAPFGVVLGVTDDGRMRPVVYGLGRK